MTPTKDAATRISKARIQLLLNAPFYATGVLRLATNIYTDEEWGRSGFPTDNLTACTDGYAIHYCESYVQKLSDKELMTLVAEEGLHCLLGHPYRRGNRDPVLWNLADDQAIFHLCKGTSWFELKDITIVPEYDRLSAEQIYAKMQQKQSQQPKGGKAGKGVATIRLNGYGDVIDGRDKDGKKLSPAMMAAAEQEWRVVREQAERLAKQAGKMPGGLERGLENMRHADIDWRDIPRQFVASAISTDYRWVPPNKRHVRNGLYMPSIQREGTGAVGVFIDVSGSVGQAEMDLFCGITQDFMDELKPSTLHVLFVDTKVQRHEQYQAGETLDFKTTGGGGTSFRPPFQFIEKHGIELDCALYLTDLESSEFPEEPPYRTLWVTTSRDLKAPFGEHIRIEEV